jgi:uncharacterized membrane protein
MKAFAGGPGDARMSNQPPDADLAEIAGASPPNGSGPSTEASGPWAELKRAFIAGVTVTLPFFITLVILVFVVQFVSGQLTPVANVLARYLGGIVPGEFAQGVISHVLALLGIVAFVLAAGFYTRSRLSHGGIQRYVDDAMRMIPGVGALYGSFTEMSELLLDTESKSFREVKLVEFPTEGSYTLAFVTAETPAVIKAGTPHQEMVSLFLPMAPNPVMGGHVIHVTTDRVYDVDLTVEEGIQSILTSGVAVGEDHERTTSTTGEPTGAD